MATLGRTAKWLLIVEPMSMSVESIAIYNIGDPGVALIIGGMATLGRTAKWLLIVEPMSMSVESIAIEAPGIKITND